MFKLGKRWLAGWLTIAIIVGLVLTFTGCPEKKSDDNSALLLLLAQKNGTKTEQGFTMSCGGAAGSGYCKSYYNETVTCSGGETSMTTRCTCSPGTGTVIGTCRKTDTGASGIYFVEVYYSNFPAGGYGTAAAAAQADCQAWSPGYVWTAGACTSLP